ncbi:hypothetical protein EV421DRAFT_106236 [Armillaria borealis]|uniref:Uncharacterized protein n=1 Tax=Armillaria borealis TaxID=47425 RepID=A0AA39MW30_9AGAR|nr:hypothetical protein EV421DRAFT_106236 [Armillaria borealis]
MPTPSLDANFVFPRSARSVRTTNAHGKWTVSPEFGDALLHAMRERPSARIPSIVELPQPKRPQLVVPLTMKTRIAVRAKTPHRFEVVPLRDVHRRAPSPMFKEITPLANARIKLRSVNAEATVRNAKAARGGRQGPTRGRENSKPPPPPPPVNRQARIPRGKNIQLVHAQPTALHAKSASLSSLHPASSPTRHSFGRSEDIQRRSQIPYSLKRRAIYTQTLFIPKLAATAEEVSPSTSADSLSAMEGTTLVDDEDAPKNKSNSLAASFFSMPSDYSQDSFQVVPKHHAIVVELMVAIDLAISEWEKMV